MRLRVGIFILYTALLGGCTMTSGSSAPSAWGSSFGDPNANIAGSDGNSAISVLMNSEFADTLEQTDRRAAEQAQDRALRARGVGATIEWNNKRTGRSGKVRSGPVYEVNDTSCREFTHEIQIDEEILTARGAACKTERDKWQVIG